jgi:hypothetical protein
MGTPSDITNATTNSASGTTHTHALGFEAAEVYLGTGANDVNFPVGHHIILFIPALVARNSSVIPTLSSAVNYQYLVTGQPNSGTVLPGTWRHRGFIDSTNSNLIQRVG